MAQLEYKLAAVVGRGEQVAQRGGAMPHGHEVIQGVHVTQALAHLGAIHQQVGHVEPNARAFTTAGAAALGDFILMVGEDEIHAARVQVPLDGG